MATTRRRFLRLAATAATVPLFGSRTLDALERRLEPFARLSPEAAATDQAFWDEIRSAFPVPTAYVHLESGFSSPQPTPTFEAFTGYTEDINSNLSYFMRRRQAAEVGAVKKSLAALAGVPEDELVITRNTTESIATVVHGLDFAPGDEAVMCDQDYGSMLEQFRQEGKRRGLKCVEVDVPLHPGSDEELVEVYARAITPRTKIMLVSHMINITGHILPVKKIAAMAHARGVSVIVDAAHSFAQVNFTVPDLDGDFLGASLHKWLCTPLGAGVLHVRKDRIKDVWPLLGDTSRPADDIRKLERTGTKPIWTVLAIGDAIRFHNMVGAARKEARLRYLREYWTDRVRGIPKVYLNTPEGNRACAIANVGVTGVTPTQLATTLFDTHRIFTVGIDNRAVKGVRVTPQLFTNTADLDALVAALRTIARG
jgi:selenocysteine lyase/cysteine desulfurase